MTFKKLISSIIMFTMFACHKDEQNVSPTISNEALTTAQLQLVNTTDILDKPTAQWEQLLDNAGKPLPVDVSQATLILKTNTTYSASIILLDKTQSPVFIASDEVKERGTYHLFFYQALPTVQTLIIPNNYPVDINDLYPVPIPTPIPVGSPLNLTITITDHDDSPQQYPIGLESTFVTGAASTGWLRVTLRHQPNVKNGTFDPGETDLDVGFNVRIQ